MKKLFTIFAVTLVAAVWMTGSWLFFNSIAAGAQGSATAAVADADKAAPKDEAAKGHCGEWKGHHRHFGRHHGHFALWKMFGRKLNLTDAQRNQIKDNRVRRASKNETAVRTTEGWTRATRRSDKGRAV